MKAISTILAIILIVIIVVALVGLTYTFATSLFGITTGAGENATEGTTESMLGQMRVITVSENIVQVRNTGLTDLSDFTVLVNGEQVQDLEVNPPVIGPNQIGTITIKDFIGTRDNEITILSEGASATYVTEEMLFCDNPDVVLCMTFDEGSGTVAHDHSPYGNDGTLNNFGSGWTRDCKFGSCLEFDGVDDYVDCGNDNSLNPTEGITIMFWAYLKQPIDCDGNNNWRYTINKGGWGAYHVIFEQGGDVTFTVKNSTGQTYRVIADLGVPVGEFHHYTGTYDASTGIFEVYYDGGLNRSETFLPALIYTDTNDLQINVNSGDSCPNGAGNFPGIIDEVKILNRTLTAEEIAEIYSG